MMRPKSLVHQITTNKTYQIYAGLAAVCFVVIVWYSMLRSSSLARLDSDIDGVGSSGAEVSSTSAKSQGTGVTKIHSTNQFVPASAFSGVLKSPLEVLKGSDTVACPERGGKNTQCGKVSAEYRFKVKQPGDYFLYIQVIAPGLNDNSLWVGVVEGADQDAFDACETPAGGSGPLIPHKHLTSSKKFLCCPAYLAKNKKKGLAGFYSDCCYEGLGKVGTEKGCVLDLEVDERQRWNQLPRVIRTDSDNQVVSIKVYAREDGTSWTGLVLSSEAALDDKAIAKFKKSSQ